MGSILRSSLHRCVHDGCFLLRRNPVGAISALVAKFTIVVERAKPPDKIY